MALKFSENLDDLFLISQEVISERGEDSYCCACREASAMVAVCDGCGGLGSRTYASTSGYTEAYLASRIVSGAIYDWFTENCDTVWKDTAELVDQMRQYVEKAYDIGTSYIARGSRIRGSMVRDFPTTAAISVVQQVGKDLYAHVVWAGDSRVYLMDRNGLAQLTKDDVESDDAMSNLSDDGALTNVVSSDGRFELHYKCIKLQGPTMVFAATDGCFGYIPSPMEFEYMLLHAIVNAPTPEEFKYKLKEYFVEVAGDDFAFACMCFGFKDFAGMVDTFADRKVFLEQHYVVPIQEDRSEEHVQQLWQEYRVNYERHYAM